MSVEVCITCKGEGTIENKVDGYHRDSITETCTRCNGTGRVYKSTYSYTIPFSTNKSLMYEYDKKIINLIRELERSQNNGVF